MRQFFFVFAGLIVPMAMAQAQSVLDPQQRHSLSGSNPEPAVATAGAWLGGRSLKMEGAQTITSAPVGIGPLTVKSSLYINDTVSDGIKSAWTNVIQTVSNTGYGNTDPEWGNEPARINLFLGMRCDAGSAACWTVNPLLYLGSGFQAAAHGIELDVENNSSDRNPSVSEVKPIVGFEITGTSRYEAAYGIDIVDGSIGKAPALFHNAIGILAGAASDNSFFDVSSSREVFHILGTHGIGFDSAYANISGAAILLNTTQHLDVLNTITGQSWTAMGAVADGIVVGANAPKVFLGHGGQSGSAYLGVTGDADGAVQMFAGGRSSNIDVDLQPKGTGVVNIQNARAASITTSGKETAQSMVATTSFQMPTVITRPTGACTSGQAVIGPAGFYVCVASLWKQAILQ